MAARAGGLHLLLSNLKRLETQTSAPIQKHDNNNQNSEETAPMDSLIIQSITDPTIANSNQITSSTDATLINGGHQSNQYPILASNTTDGVGSINSVSSYNNNYNLNLALNAQQQQHDHLTPEAENQVHQQQ